MNRPARNHGVGVAAHVTGPRGLSGGQRSFFARSFVAGGSWPTCFHASREASSKEIQVREFICSARVFAFSDRLSGRGRGRSGRSSTCFLGAGPGIHAGCYDNSYFLQSYLRIVQSTFYACRKRCSKRRRGGLMSDHSCQDAGVYLSFRYEGDCDLGLLLRVSSSGEAGGGAEASRTPCSVRGDRIFARVCAVLRYA